MGNNFVDEIRAWYRTGGMHVKLIMVNAIVFLGIGVIEVFTRLLSPNSVLGVNAFFSDIFGLQTSLTGFITHPWGLFTSIFAHFGFWHFAMNMIFLFFAGRMFEQFFDAKRLFHTYLLGGLIGGLLELIAPLIFPGVADQAVVVVGASGSIMAIFMAIAFHRPQLTVSLFGVLPVRIIFIALFFLLSDLFALGTNDGTAHFAHIGGAILGILSVRNLYAKKNLITRSGVIGDHIMAFFKRLFKPNKLKVVHATQKPFKKDEEYNYEAKLKQEKIDAILDKISRAGYESLTKEEKQILFKQSQK